MRWEEGGWRIRRRGGEPKRGGPCISRQSLQGFGRGQRSSAARHDPFPHLSVSGCVRNLSLRTQSFRKPNGISHKPAFQITKVRQKRFFCSPSAFQRRFAVRPVPCVELHPKPESVYVSDQGACVECQTLRIPSRFLRMGWSALNRNVITSAWGALILTP